MNNEETYQSINQRINQSVRQYRIPFTVEKDTALNSLLTRIKEKKIPPQKNFHIPAWGRTVAAAAAVVILVMMGGWMLNTQNIANRGKAVANLWLPDHSRVLLTDGSTLKFNRYISKRKVQLNGKAYFEVKKGNKFQVLARNGIVEVLGTRFTIDDRNDQLEVVCFEGKVRATYNRQEVILGPGSGVSFSDDSRNESMTVAESFPVMAMFSEIYSNDELDAVLKDLEVFFGVKIYNEVGKMRYFSGTLNTGTLETALDIVVASLEIGYKKQDDNSIIVY